MMRFGSAKTLGVLALAAVWIAPLDAFGQSINWQRGLQRNQQQGSNPTSYWRTPGALVRKMNPEITDVDVIGDSVPTNIRSAPFRVRVAWTEDAAIVNRMSELGSARDGFCIERTAHLSLEAGYYGNHVPGGECIETTSPEVMENCYDSGDRFTEFEVPGNTKTVSVRVRTRFGSHLSGWSAERSSGVLATRC